MFYAVAPEISRSKSDLPLKHFRTFRQRGGCSLGPHRWGQVRQGRRSAIISSYVPVLMEANHRRLATLHRDGFISIGELGEAARGFPANTAPAPPSSTVGSGVQLHAASLVVDSRKNITRHLCRAPNLPEIHRTIKAPAREPGGARAGLDGVGCTPPTAISSTQFLSSGINDRKRIRRLAVFAFLARRHQAIRAEVGGGFHLQPNQRSIDHNNVIPWKRRGILSGLASGRALLQNAKIWTHHVRRAAVPASIEPAGVSRSKP